MYRCPPTHITRCYPGLSTARRSATGLGKVRSLLYMKRVRVNPITQRYYLYLYMDRSALGCEKRVVERASRDEWFADACRGQ